MITFGELKSRYLVVCQFEAVEGWHIGTGTPLGDTDAPVVRGGGVPLIPGSSLRGALRARVEAIVRSLEVPAAAGCCTLFEETEAACVSSRKETRKEFEGEDAETAFENLLAGNQKLCPLCRLFGSTIMAAKLKVGDARTGGEQICNNRDGVGINRDTGTAQDKLKYDFEVVEGGLKYRTTLTLENAEVSDLALLNILLSEWMEGLDIGGRKARGLGRTVLKALKVSYFGEGPGGTYSLQDYLRARKLRDVADPGQFLAWLGTKFDEFCALEEAAC